MLQPVAGRFPRQPWAYSTRPIADQTGHVMRAPTLSRIGNQRTLQPQLLAQEVVMHRSNGQEGGHRHRCGTEL